MSTASWVFEWRCRRAATLLERRRRRRLESDLSVYVSPGERADLWALLDSLDDDQTLEVREILGRQAVRGPVQGCGRRRAAAGFGVTRTA